ncbi:LysR family transcriptional regulator [Bordetella ansorpii]|uniref:LysR family transcriptional regulator n=1 Tax=Bordetella ansorpii TaxID=288768 RepID=A0A157LTM7_9BORD|nr:LysR substrate-binding domain-containing protein [Bordetella ansorpii]SAH99784.1 LysR family transcriptional regulator [Bordetella ansorpii]
MAGRVTFRHLEAFRAVMLRKTVTSAAEMMHVSQPVVTRLLNALEERLDFRLFERVKGRLTPTAQALLLFDEVQRSLRGVDHVLGVAQEIRDQHYGRLHIAAAPVMALSFLPKVIAEFSRTRPRVAVTLVMHSSRTVVDMVLGEQCDVGFGILPEVSRGQFGELLMSARLVCGLPLGHPLASRSRLSPKDLAGEHFVSHSTMLDVRLRIDSVFAAHGVQRALTIETPTSQSILALVEAGAGVALIDPLTAACYQGGKLRFLPFDPVIKTGFSMLTAPGRLPSMLLEPFAQEVRRSLASLVDPAMVLEGDQEARRG